jgi:hypothetical protein
MKIDWLKGSILLVALLLLCSACGTAAPSGASAAPLGPQLRSYSASVRVQVGQPTSVSASCKSGEQMIGGGFAASDLFEYAAYIEASYPSSASTWTVTGAAPASYFDLAAEVYCVSAPVSLGMQIVRGAGASGGRVACPRGTRLLSGGFRGSQPVAVSYPQENGWSSASSDQVYALCAGQHVTAGPVVTSVFYLHSSETGYQPGGGSTNCPAGQFAAGGGFASQGALILSSALSGPHLAGWSVVAGGDADVTVYALCAALGERS